MNPPLASIILSFLVPTMGLILAFASMARLAGRDPQGWKWRIGMVSVSLAIVLTPVGGLPLARWLAGIVDHWSLPFSALIASAVMRQLFGWELMGRKDREAAWLFGTLAGLLLYLLALGWGPFDPYGLGWHFGPLFALIAVLASVLIWRKNRFGVVLVLAIAAWHLKAVESANYWDCLIDPFFFLASAGVVVSWSVKRWRQG